NEIIKKFEDYDGNYQNLESSSQFEERKLKEIILKKRNGETIDVIATTSIMSTDESKFYISYINHDNSNINIVGENPESVAGSSFTDKIIESCVDGVVITDAKGSIIQVNSSAEKIFGYTIKELLGKRVMDFIPPEEKYFIEGTKMVEQLMTDGAVTPFESAVVNKSTEIVPVEWTMSYFYDERGNIAGSIGICRDLRERKMLEYQVLQSNKLAALGQLAAGIAHEINNPLAGIVGYTQFIIKKMKEKSEEGLTPDEINNFVEKLEKIEREAHKSKHIIQNLLKFSRGNDVYRMDAVNLNEIMENALDVVGNNILLNNIIIEKDLSEDTSPIRGNTFQLEQVFTNLIINACQAMPDGGTLTLMTGDVPNKKGSPEYVYAVVADTGEGIEKGYLTRIFDPFFTTKRPGAGTGLGLSVSYGIIRQHQGEIEVSSEKGCGTVFFLYFPVFKEE
ncbi:MAG: PAS domain S-box protein, partial [Candidatus Schekmanbacteria bacterium]